VKTAEMVILTSPVLVLIFQALVSLITAQNPGKFTMHFMIGAFRAPETHLPLPADELTKIDSELI
jgi:hypothetical protein